MSSSNGEVVAGLDPKLQKGRKRSRKGLRKFLEGKKRSLGREM